jgi:hypothetical protein
VGAWQVLRWGEVALIVSLRNDLHRFSGAAVLRAHRFTPAGFSSLQDRDDGLSSPPLGHSFFNQAFFCSVLASKF